MENAEKDLIKLLSVEISEQYFNMEFQLKDDDDN